MKLGLLPMVFVGYAWSRTAKVTAFSGEKCKHFSRLLLCFTFLCIAMGSSAPGPPRYRNIIPLRRNADPNSAFIIYSCNPEFWGYDIWSWS